MSDGQIRVHWFDTAETPKNADEKKSKYAGMVAKNGLADRFSVDIFTVEVQGIEEHRIMLVDNRPDETPPAFLKEAGFVMRRSREHKSHIPDDSFYRNEDRPSPVPPARSGRVLRGAEYRYNGESHTLVEWARLVDIDYDVLRSRLVSGWAIGEALTRPVEPRRKRSA